MYLFYEIFRWFGLLCAWPWHILWFKKKVYYEDKKEQGRFVKGGALVVSNHYNVLDFFLNVILFPFRKLYPVTGEMVYRKSKFFHFGMKFFGGIRSNRDVMSRSFIDESVRLLEKGKMVQIFPEAYNSPDGTMQEFKPSYIMIALQANVPIIPVILDGNYGVFKRAHLIIGKKIYLSDYCTSSDPTKEEIRALNDMVRAKAEELKNELDARVARDSHRARKKAKENKND